MTAKTNWKTNPRKPRLRFNPYAWAKLLLLRDLGETEIGGFGLAAVDDPLLVEDVRLVAQRTTPVSVALDDGAVADYCDELVDRGISLERGLRIWVHTHPADCPRPSSVDEATFERAFGRAPWSVMFILAKGGASYARLQFSAGPGGAWRIPVEIDYTRSFPAADPAAWCAEYAACVREEPPLVNAKTPVDRLAPWWDESWLLEDFANDEPHGAGSL